ncbi:aspartic proteinase-like protein 2 [Tanacetum coccineum]
MCPSFNLYSCVDRGFPDVIFHFENSLSLKVRPSQYLFEVADQDWCVGFQDNDLQSQGKEITLLGGSSSIKVKDEESGNVYSVGAHNLSPADRISTPTGIVVSCFMFLLMANFINPRIN